MALRHVELIRSRVLRGQMGELARIRNFVSATEGNQEAVDALRGESGNLILARVTELILQEIGHVQESTNRKNGAHAPVESKASQVRRAVRRISGKGQAGAAEQSAIDASVGK